MLSHNNNIKWNLWLTMLESAIELKNAICIFINKNWDSMQKDNLSCNKWDIIHKTIAILRPFKDIMKSLKNDSTTLNKILQSMDFLIEHVKSQQEEHAADINLSASLLIIWFAFDKYYKLTDKTPAYVSAFFLNPML